jgi:hypothetical protein
MQLLLHQGKLTSSSKSRRLKFVSAVTTRLTISSLCDDDHLQIPSFLSDQLSNHFALCQLSATSLGVSRKSTSISAINLVAVKMAAQKLEKLVFPEKLLQKNTGADALHKKLKVSPPLRVETSPEPAH